MDLTEEEHFDIVRRKTAYLFAGCARIGGMLGPTTREQQEALWDYGLNIGMAFQMVDDLLDFTGEEVALGKPVGGDLREGKMTLPVIHLLARGDARADARSCARSSIADVTHDEWREMRRAARPSRVRSTMRAGWRASSWSARRGRCTRSRPPKRATR